MDFQISSDPRMEGQGGYISLPQNFRMELGVLVGQFVQLQDSVLQIVESLDGEQEQSFVSGGVFDRLKEGDTKLKVLEVTLGCDPEFFIFYPNKSLASATTYLNSMGEIGCDGILGEWRPHYGLDENEVTETLKSLIYRTPASMKRAPWARGLPENGRNFLLSAYSWHMGLPAGFHIHLGIPPEILNTRKEFNWAAMNHIIRCLDWYVSVPLVPLETDHGRRLGKSQYGKPSDSRPTNVTLEYRTPGAFYLRTPVLAAGMMGIALLVAESVVSRMKEESRGFVNLHKLTGSQLQNIMPIPEDNMTRGILLSKGIRKAQGALDSIQRRLSELPTYDRHRSAIEEFFRVVENNKQPGPNLLKNWKE